MAQSKRREETPAEIKRWSDKVEASSLYVIWRSTITSVQETRKLGLDPEKTTTERLDIDDRVSHAQKAA